MKQESYETYGGYGQSQPFTPGGYGGGQTDGGFQSWPGDGE